MKIPNEWVLLLLVNKLGKVFGIDPVVDGGFGLVLFSSGALLCKKIFLLLFDVTHFRGDITFPSFEYVSAEILGCNSITALVKELLSLIFLATEREKFEICFNSFLDSFDQSNLILDMIFDFRLAVSPWFVFHI